VRPRFRLEEREPASLIPNPANFRRHPDQQVKALRQSLEEFGHVAAPILNSRSGHLIDGHARVEIALADGEATIPVNVVDLSPAGERRLLRSLDRIGAMALIDEGALSALIESIDDAALEQLLDEVVEPASGLLPEADPDAIPEVVETRCKSGELWALGEHRLLCGDSTDPDRVNLLMSGFSCPAMLTDPPYQMGKDIENDDLGAYPYYALHKNVMLAAPLDLDATMVWFHGTRAFPVALAAAEANRWKFERMLWLYKPNDQTFPWRGWLLISEAILVFSQGAGHWNDAHPFHHDAYEFNHRGGELFPEGAYHPTVKPCEVVADIVTRIAAEGETVYDPFAGSGTTLIACEQTGRVARCLEIEPRYVDVCLARWEQATGREAQRL
jgi:hypothetical protein